MCGAPDQSITLPAGTDLTKETVLVGRVLSSGTPVGGAFVRLLDGTGEFTICRYATPERSNGETCEPPPFQNLSDDVKFAPYTW